MSTETPPEDGQDPTRTPDGLAGIDFPVVLFDGECGFCNASVVWVADRDAWARLHFAAQGSTMGRYLLEEQGLDEVDGDTMVLVEDGKAYLRSTAALRIARLLGFPWFLGAVFLLVPAFLRDAVYDLIARNRYRIAGKVDACVVPDPAWAARFHH